MLSLITIDGRVHEATAGERVIDLINRSEVKLPQVCFHPQVGPIQTCDTCMVEVDGALVRACATTVSAGTSVQTNSAAANDAQREAMDRILSNHLLYCTVCDNSNGDCTVHNTTKLLGIEHQEIPFRTKLYDVDNTENVGPIYDLMLTAWGTASAVGPLLIAYMRQTTGSYRGHYVIAGIMVVSAILPILVSRPRSGLPAREVKFQDPTRSPSWARKA
jgi:aerobic-type carbon monoxide dehydrogenase small subunit (CoxS/CutS family)